MSTAENQIPRKINLIPNILLALVVFIAFVALGFFIPKEISSAMMDELSTALKPLESLGPFALFLIIFFNNAIKCLMVILFGIVIGLPSIIFIGFNGITIGMLASALAPQVGYKVIVASMLPHGIIEIPVLVLSTALGLSIGAEVFKFIIRQKSQVRWQMKYGIAFYGRWLILLLFLSAIVEVFVTPLFVQMAGGNITIINP